MTSRYRRFFLLFAYILIRTNAIKNSKVLYCFLMKSILNIHHLKFQSLKQGVTGGSGQPGLTTP